MATVYRAHIGRLIGIGDCAAAISLGRDALEEFGIRSRAGLGNSRRSHRKIRRAWRKTWKTGKSASRRIATSAADQQSKPLAILLDLMPAAYLCGAPIDAELGAQLLQLAQKEGSRSQVAEAHMHGAVISSRHGRIDKRSLELRELSQRAEEDLEDEGKDGEILRTRGQFRIALDRVPQKERSTPTNGDQLLPRPR